MSIQNIYKWAGSVRMIVVIFFIFASAGKIQAQHVHPLLYHEDHKVIVIAHRGNHVNVPENTLAAYREAIDCGADYVEIDLRTTKDGHLVIMHNAEVDERTDGQGAVRDLDYKTIKGLKIHAVKKGDRKIYHIPDLKSVLRLCKGKINIYLDFKDADVIQTYQLIKKMDMQDHVAVYLNKEQQYKEWKETAPHMPLIASLPEKMSLRQLDSLLRIYKIDIVDNVYDPEKIRFLHEKGIAIWLDVEGADEDSTVWRRTLSLNPDGLQTDHPEKLIRFLEEKRVR